MYNKKEKKKNLLTLSKYVPQSGEQFGSRNFVLLLLSLVIISTWYEQWGWGVGGELVSGFIINPMKGAEMIV